MRNVKANLKDDAGTRYSIDSHWDIHNIKKVRKINKLLLYFLNINNRHKTRKLYCGKPLETTEGTEASHSTH